MSPNRPTEDDFDRRLIGDVVDRAPDAVIIVDAQGHICYWNAGAERIFGFPTAAAMGETLDIVIPERLQERHWSAFNRAVSTGTSRYGAEDMLSVPARTRDGRTISIEFTVVLVRDGDSISHIGAVLRDVTARRNLELELRGRIRELEEARPG
jgi:PAS domain S-box-containing protein